MNLAVVIPTCSQRDLVALSDSLSFPIYVVYDGKGSLPSFGSHRVLQGPRKGFAQACNVGLSQAQQDGYSRVLILNDDVRIDNASIERLLSRCSSQIGAVGPVVYSGEEVESAGICVQSYGRVVLQKKIPSTFSEVDALAGASLLIPSWSRFDKRFVHGFEDIALCFRLRKLGYQIILDPKAVCHHLGGGTIPHESSDWFAYSIYGQLLFYNRKYLLGPIVSLAILQGLKTGKTDSFRGIKKGLCTWLSRIK